MSTANPSRATAAAARTTPRYTADYAAGFDAGRAWARRQVDLAALEPAAAVLATIDDALGDHWEAADPGAVAAESYRALVPGGVADRPTVLAFWRSGLGFDRGAAEPGPVAVCGCLNGVVAVLDGAGRE